jgi:hypothetical protein
VSGVVSRFVVAVLVAAAGAVSAHAEELVMPYACSAGSGEVKISPANETSYRMLGHRDEQPFVICGSGKSACETIMVHRFAIECDGQRVSWSHVANAARAAGVSLPAGLPNGFAPVSALSGRFVLPALVRTQPNLTQVSTQDLSPDSVLDQREYISRTAAPAWVTEVRADSASGATGSNALRLAGSLATVLALLMSASLVAARRWLSPLTRLFPSTASFDALRLRVDERAREIGDDIRKRFSQALKSLTSAPDGPPDELANAFLVLEARLAESDLRVASMEQGMLLRSVLASELQNIRARVADVKRQKNRRAPAQSAAMVRSLLRELERISRISQSAEREPVNATADSIRMPQSIAEAYRVLGMNADAAPPVAKKLVDALRMSWHPDHARDEDDRQRREDRMKQINAAWDMINDRRAAA